MITCFKTTIGFNIPEEAEAASKFQNSIKNLDEWKTVCLSGHISFMKETTYFRGIEKNENDAKKS